MALLSVRSPSAGFAARGASTLSRRCRKQRFPECEGTMHRFKQAAFILLAMSMVALSGCEGLKVTDVPSLLAPRFTRSEVLGFVAGFGTTFAAVPDVIAMLRRRSSKGMNPTMAAIMGVFQILWVWYGLLIVSRPVILWNLIAVATNFFCVAAYFHLARAERQEDEG